MFERTNVMILSFCGFWSLEFAEFPEIIFIKVDLWSMVFF